MASHKDIRLLLRKATREELEEIVGTALLGLRDKETFDAASSIIWTWMSDTLMRLSRGKKISAGYLSIDDLEEIVQEAYISITTNSSYDKALGKATSYLVKVLANTTKSYLKKTYYKVDLISVSDLPDTVVDQLFLDIIEDPKCEREKEEDAKGLSQYYIRRMIEKTILILETDFGQDMSYLRSVMRTERWDAITEAVLNDVRSEEFKAIVKNGPHSLLSSGPLLKQFLRVTSERSGDDRFTMLTQQASLQKFFVALRRFKEPGCRK